MTTNKKPQPAEPRLVEAIKTSVTASRKASDNVSRRLLDLEKSLTPILVDLDQRARDSGNDEAQRVVSSVRQELSETKTQIEDRRELLRDFRIAMFGRTGTGKSSLIEALTKGSGTSISPGRSDHTEDVSEASWGPLKVVDMPGILGAGRRLSRAELESRAKSEVKRADLVILAFDTQNQQISEFEQIAQMVVSYGKPVVVVLNVRNARWRSPAPTLSRAERRNYDLTVKQHIGHIVGQLASIGVMDVDVIAINTQRATYANCSPFRGPHKENRKREVNAYGAEMLLKASNLPAFEDYIHNLIAMRCTELRLAGLYGDLKKATAEISTSLLAFSGDFRRQEEMTEKVFDDIGYPRKPVATDQPAPNPDSVLKALLEARERTPFETRSLELAAKECRTADRGVSTAAVTSCAGNELKTLEEIRGERFSVKRGGPAPRNLKNRLAVIERMRLQARIDADDRVEELSKYGGSKGGEVKLNAICDPAGELAANVEQAVESAISDTCRDVELKIKSVDLALKIDSAAHFISSGGIAQRRVSHVFRFGGAVAGVAGVVAATNFWNPGGWVAAGIAGAAVSLTWLGQRLHRGSEKKRRKKRAQNLAQVRRAVDEHFDRVARTAERAYWSLLTLIFADLLVPRLRYLTELRLAFIASTEAGAVQEAIPAQVAYLSGSAGGRAPLDGSGWAPSGSGSHDAQCSAHQRRKRRYPRLTWKKLTAPGSQPIQAIEKPLANLEGHLPPEARSNLNRELRRIQRSAPRLVLTGDYSAGKSSLRAALTRRTRRGRRQVKRSGDPTTTRLEQGRLGSWVVVDTPGLGSGRAGDENIGVDESLRASLVLHLVTPRLIADVPSEIVERVSSPGALGAAERARNRFVLSRIDEMGAQPNLAPGEFERLALQKRRELARILTERGCPTAPDQVLLVSADPFGSQFDDATLSDAENWSGVKLLREELEFLSEAGADKMRRNAAAAYATWFVLDLCETYSDYHRQLQGELAMCARTSEALRLDLDRTAKVRESLALSLRKGIGEVLTELTDAVLCAEPKHRKAAKRELDNWNQDPRIREAIDAWMHRCQREIDRLRQDIGDDVSRSLDSLARKLAAGHSHRKVGPEVKDDPSGRVNAAKRTSKALKFVPEADAAAVLAARDQLAKVLPKIKFKPWGATKLASKITKVARAAAVVAVVVDLATWVYDSWSAKKRDSDDRETRKRIEEAVVAITKEIFSGPDSPEAIIDQLEDVLRECQDQTDDTKHCLDKEAVETQELLGHLDDFTKVVCADGASS